MMRKNNPPVKLILRMMEMIMPMVTGMMRKTKTFQVSYDNDDVSHNVNDEDQSFP